MSDEIFPHCSATQCEFYHEGGCIIEEEYPDMKPCPPERRNNESLCPDMKPCLPERRNNESLCEACFVCEGCGTVIDRIEDIEITCPECGGLCYFDKEFLMGKKKGVDEE